MVFFVLGFAAGWLTLMAIFKFVEYKVDRELNTDNKWADYLISGMSGDSFTVHADNGDNIGKAQQRSRDQVIKDMVNGLTYSTINQSSDSSWNLGRNVNLIRVDGNYFIRTDTIKVPADSLEFD